MPKRPQYSPIAANILYMVVFGTLLVIAAMAILLGISYFFVDRTFAPGNFIVCCIAGVYVTITYVLSRWHYYTVAAYLLVFFYLLLASGIAWCWGINTPIGLLIFGTVIVLAGIVLTARHALIACLVSGMILVAIQTTTMAGWHQPDTSWTINQSNFGDVLAYCTVFSMLALVSWLYNREIERSLTQAKEAEAALQLQKATLKKQVKERTKDLRRIQLEEMRRMYHFAHLGQLGVTLLHDLANHLTALTLEIEGMKDKQHPGEKARAQQITQYLSDLVDSTRKRLNGGIQNQTFDIIRSISETVDFLHYKATQNNVVIDWQPPVSALRYTGDPDSFCQIVAILTSNAVDASSHSSRADPARVAVKMQLTSADIIIHIKDWGKGITKNQRKKLFKPQHSTKESGLGLGLYIAKQTIEMQFSGTITLSPSTDHTEFIISLPRKND